MFEVSTLILLAWGALAFGAEYAWAYAPLLAFSAVPAAIGFRQQSGCTVRKSLLIVFIVITSLSLFQAFAPRELLPRKLQTNQTADFGRLYSVVTMQAVPAETAGTISIAPQRTLLGAAFLVFLTLLLAGCTKAISALGTRRLVNGIVVIATVVAFVALIQSSVKAEAIYGFWRQPRAGIPFAPFINENHFTGWMAMALSLAIGAFAGDVSVAMKNAGAGWRNRMLWFSSARASGLILTAGAVALMALAMVVATSRGGLVGLALIFAVGVLMFLRRQHGLRRSIGSAFLVLIIVVAAVWGGAGKTIDQFSGASKDWGGRKNIWADTVRIIKDYPITGTGLNTYGIAMLHYQTQSISRGAVVEAHNDYLQLAAEGGLMLGIPILWALAIFVREIWKRFKEGLDDEETYWQRAGAVTGLCTIAVMEVFDFTLQMPGAAVMFVVLAAIAIHKPNYLLRRAAESPADRRV